MWRFFEYLLAMDILSTPFTIYTSPSLSLLFLLSFLAATVLPIGSEWLLVVMIAQGFPPLPVVSTATIGNYLGGCTTYLIGIWGSEYCIQKILRISESNLNRAANFYGKYGVWSLLLSWLPVIGDPLCLLAGIFGIGFLRFSIFVFLGKLSRYAILAFLTQQGAGG